MTGFNVVPWGYGVASVTPCYIGVFRGDQVIYPSWFYPASARGTTRTMGSLVEASAAPGVNTVDAVQLEADGRYQLWL